MSGGGEFVVVDASSPSPVWDRVGQAALAMNSIPVRSCPKPSLSAHSLTLSLSLLLLPLALAYLSAPPMSMIPGHPTDCVATSVWHANLTSHAPVKAPMHHAPCTPCTVLRAAAALYHTSVVIPRYACCVALPFHLRSHMLVDGQTVATGVQRRSTCTV